MITIITILHVIVCLLLILVILLQIGKAGSLGGLFGGGGGEQLFSTPSGSNFLRKLTVGFTVIFIITSLSLTFLSYRKKLKTVTSLAPVVQQQTPVQQGK